MNQNTPKVKTTNTQSVRLPMPLYEQIAELSLTEEVSMTTMIIRLLNLGLGYQNNFDKAVRDFVFRSVSKQEMDDLINGKIPTITS